MIASRWSGIVSLCSKATPVFIFASMLFGCQAGPPVRIQPLPMAQLSVPEDNQHYRELAWLAPDVIVVNYDTTTTTRIYFYQMGVYHPSEGGLVPIDLPPDHDPRCLRSEFSDPDRLPDGRLGYVRSCWMLNDERRVFLFAWDPQTQYTEQLFPYAYPWEGKHITPSYAPDLSRGVAGDITSIEDHLHWLERDGVHPLDVGMMRANRPRWSPDGQWIAFTGDKTMQGDLGPDWAGQLYDLWLMPATCDHEGKPCTESLQRLIQGLEPNGMQWSPDSKRIAFGGYPNGHSNGIWILDMGSGSLTQIATGDYSMPAWSPDGRQIAVVGPWAPVNPNDPNGPTHPKTLHVIDVSGLN